MGRLRQRLHAVRTRFIDRRTPARTLPLRITRRRIYILPTRSGALFGLLLIVMLLGATNYSNSLAFALSFWLAGVALVSMHHAHANLVHLQLVGADATPVFAGEPAHFALVLRADGNRRHRAIRLRTDAQRDTPRQDMGPGETARTDVTCQTSARGRLRCPRLRVESIYPVGLFRAWSWLQPDTQALVYPRPLGHERLPVRSGDAGTAAVLSTRGHEDFLGHRDYAPGDSPRHIDWKASARSDDLRLREHTQPRAAVLWLDERAAGGGSREARLSQLARWVIAADRAGLNYGLRLVDGTQPPASGPVHRAACLRALALA